MPRTIRSFIGTIVMVIFVTLYALIVVAFSPLILLWTSGHMSDLAFKIVQALYYVVAGLGWILPLLPLIKWMVRPDPPAAASGPA